MKALLQISAITGVLLVSAIGLLLSSCEKDHSFITDLALNNELIIIPKEQITSRVIVFSNTNWKVEIENPESASWISLSPDEHVTSVNGSGQSYFQLQRRKILPVRFVKQFL